LVKTLGDENAQMKTPAESARNPRQVGKHHEVDGKLRKCKSSVFRYKLHGRAREMGLCPYNASAAYFPA
jgi:hypothetical protein